MHGFAASICMPDTRGPQTRVPTLLVMIRAATSPTQVNSRTKFPAHSAPLARRGCSGREAYLCCTDKSVILGIESYLGHACCMPNEILQEPVGLAALANLQVAERMPLCCCVPMLLCSMAGTWAGGRVVENKQQQSTIPFCAVHS